VAELDLDEQKQKELAQKDDEEDFLDECKFFFSSVKKLLNIILTLVVSVVSSKRFGWFGLSDGTSDSGMYALI